MTSHKCDASGCDKDAEKAVKPHGSIRMYYLCRFHYIQYINGEPIVDLVGE